LEAKNADQRRDAVTRIGEAGYYASENAFHVLDAVARTDPAPQVRCVAVRTLARYQDERPVATLMAILTTDGAGGQAIPANDDLRWETARAVLAFHRRGMLTAEQQKTACDVYLQLLRNDRNRNVRLTAVEALGCFKDKRVLSPLINTLRGEDFMMADTAERSLMALTGVSHEYNADAWAKWVEQTPEPFAHAGEPVATSRPAGPTWWDKQQRVWRKALRLQVD
jgi:HEAT repeat protein